VGQPSFAAWLARRTTERRNGLLRGTWQPSFAAWLARRTKERAGARSRGADPRGVDASAELPVERQQDRTHHDQRRRTDPADRLGAVAAFAET
jgi:hypothetical protein